MCWQHRFPRHSHLSLSVIAPGKSSKLHQGIHTQMMNLFFAAQLTLVSICKSPEENIAYEFVFSAQHVLLVLLGWFVRWEVSGHTAAIL